MQIKKGPSKKVLFAKLNRDEPFSASEKKKYSKQELALIRGLQLRNSSDKNNAIEFFDNYKKRGKSAVKNLAGSVRIYIEAKYPKIGGQTVHDVSEFNKPQKRPKILANRREVNAYIADETNKEKSLKAYNRVVSAFVKYPNASLGELRHGVKSPWSEEYRVKHGFSREYK